LKTRSRTEIVDLILQAVEAQPITRSKVMYEVMLSFKMTTDYISLLTEQGLLSYVKQDKKYAITDKGRQFLALYNETDKLLTTPAHDNDEEDEDDYRTSDNLQMQKQYGEVTII
jgi:predicted transcriptional regulator